MSMLVALAAGTDAGTGGLAATSIGPGLIGFVAIFAVVVAAIFLFRSMTGHLRKVDYRERQRQRAEHDEADERAKESSLEDPGNDEEGEGKP